MALHGTGQIHAIGAGLCAACASVFAKLAVTSDVVFDMCQSMLHLTTADQQDTSESTGRHSSVQQDVWTDFCLPVKISRTHNILSIADVRIPSVKTAIPVPTVAYVRAYERCK